MSERVWEGAARRRRRDRRGRGLRGRLVPSHLPLHRTKSAQFDELVLDAVEHLEHRWSDEIAKMEFAVEDVPPTEGDGTVPLSRLLPATIDPHGHPLPARIIVYRRPIEARAVDAADLGDLVLDVVVHELAHHLGLDPGVIDPEGHDEHFDDEP